MEGPVDVAVFAPGLLAGGGAEKTALSVAAALSDVGLSVVCFTDQPVDPAWLGEHFGLAVRDVRFAVLPPPVRTRIRAPRAILDMWEDLRMLRAVKGVRARLFVNVKFKSSLPGAGTANWYFTHFPHPLDVAPRSGPHAAYLRLVAWARRLVLHPRSRSFIESYDLVTANSRFTGENVAERWGVVAETMYPPCDLAPGTDTTQPRDRIILAVGRFQGQVANFAGHLPGQPCYRCFVGDAFDAQDCDTCAADGVLGAMVGMVGTFAAMHAMRVLLAGHATLGDPQFGTLHLIDGLAPSMRPLRVAKDPGCRACGVV